MKRALVLTIFLSLQAHADISSDMNRFFQDLGYGASVTQSGAYKGQSAGYYTGGSLFLRSGIRNEQLVSAQLPRFRGGCGGIDMFTGSFSHIRAKELIESLKNIANNVPAFAFQIAIDTMTPMVKKQITELREVADRINGYTINSCEQSAALVGSLWPKTQYAQRNVCQNIGTAKGIFADMARAKQACGAEGELSKTLAKGKNDAEFKDLIMDEGNLTWRIIHKNSLLSSDKQTAELLMSVAGSIIIRKEGNNDDAKNTFVPLNSLATNDKVIHALLNGGSTKIYTCDDRNPDKCLKPTLSSVNISATSAFKTKVGKILSQIQNKIYQDKALNSEEKALLESTKLPVYKILNVNAAYAKGSTVIDVDSYADVIAADIVYQYLASGIEEILLASHSLQLPKELLTSFRDGVMNARTRVLDKQRQTKDRMFTALKLIQATQVLERQLAGVLSADLVGTLKWSKGLR